ncbi:hypothetical protein AVEN_127449-1, partial [Araneus ventricosus]
GEIRTTYTKIYTDGSKTEQGVWAAFCVSDKQNLIYIWSAKLRDDNIIFQAELIAYKKAVQHSIHINNKLHILIQVDDQASHQA